MATTYSDTSYPARSNSALFWGIAIAVILALVIYFATRGDSDRTMATPGAGSTTTDSTNTQMGTTTGTVGTPADTTATTPQSARGTSGTTDTSNSNTNNSNSNNSNSGQNRQ